jgi:hypothetical protein
MSTSPTPASTATQTSTAVQGPAGQRKAAAQTGTDIFSSLLALLGDTRQGGALAADPLAHDSSLTGATQGDADEDLNNPLSNLLNWAYPSGLGDLSGQAEALGRTRADPGATSSARGMLSPNALGIGSGQRPTAGIDLSGLGLTPVSSDEQNGTQATALLARGMLVTPTATSSGGTAEGGQTQAANHAQASARATLLAGQTAADTPLSAALNKGRKSGYSVTAALQARDATSQDMARLQPHALPATPRSTVALDSRLASTAWRTTNTETPSLTPTSAGASELRRATGEQPAPRDQLAPLALEATQVGSTTSESSLRTEGEARADQLSGHPEAELETPGHLGAHQLRHATLRVGEGGTEAIDVQLSISGQEVRVDFRTDSAEARQGIQQSAEPALSELLERSGMQLGGVSVGGQGLTSGSGQGSDADAQRRNPKRDARAVESTEPAAALTSRPRADGSRPLDVFA